jgi:outer membrane protein TolC
MLAPSVRRSRLLSSGLTLVVALIAGAAPAGTEPMTPPPLHGSGEELMATLDEPLLRLAQEVVTRDPTLQRLEATARAAAAKVPQVASLPDPVASLTVFLMPPETRVGPQRGTVSVTQRLPWLGTLSVREQVAAADAAAARAHAWARSLELITKVRTLAAELAFLDRERKLVADDRLTLERFEELARARFESGNGTSAPVITLQAEITRADNRMLEIASRRHALQAELNGLRAQPADTPLPELGLDLEEQVASTALPPLDVLRRNALVQRPEIVAAEAAAMAAEARVELARQETKPSLRVGIGYTIVGERDDPQGRANPPRGNGDDILGVTGGLNLPIWREPRVAAIEEAGERRLAAEAAVRAEAAAIERELGDLSFRIPLLVEQLDLHESVLLVQAAQAVQTLESAYAAGTSSALELIDAERTLLSLRRAEARLHADLAIAIARLEGAVASPLETLQ